MQTGRIVITGGAGYLGRCTAEVFRKKGLVPVILDNFSTSKRPTSLSYECYQTELVDFDRAREVFLKLGPVDAIIHFAAKALVSESCEMPALYFLNNINATVTVAQLATEFKVPYLVHSSSCSVYGIPVKNPIPESAKLEPLSPYGESKLASERILDSFSKHCGLKTINLRYFNPAGAIFGGEYGESHEPETHLVPSIVNAFIQKKPMVIYGNDYSTPDRTCVRDFIHVEDLIDAHLLALNYLKSNHKNPIKCLNIGRGTGHSVLEIIQTAEKVFGRKLPVIMEPRRPGDPSELVADIELMKKTFNWTPKKEIDQMLLDHLQWVRSQPKP